VQRTLILEPENDQPELFGTPGVNKAIGAASPKASALLLIVDGHAYAYRAFYAIRSLSSPSGEGTNAICGFINMLRKMRERLQPTHIVVTWDGGLAPERMAILPEYKAQRLPSPPDLDRQIEEIGTYLKAAGIACLSKVGVEADDWIATLARESSDKGMQVVIASPDKDFMQLVDANVGIVNPGDKSESIWTDEHVRNKTGVSPAQVLDWLSLIGDSVDNIDGVPGIGPKTAAELLGQFGSIDGIYEHIGEIKSPKLRSTLIEWEPMVRRNQQLIRLNDTLVCELQLTDCGCAEGDLTVLKGLYAKWGFKGLLREVENLESKRKAA
jgi:DNA polymerase-1